MRLEIILALCFMIFLISCADIPPKPELNGEGPLKIELNSDVISTPEFHNPLDPWKEWHMFYVTNGTYTEESCMYCHNPTKSCNNCHSYVGVVEVFADAPDETFVQGYNRLEKKTNAK